MKKVKTQVAEEEMRREYDFSGAVRGKYFERSQRGSNLILLEPDVSAAFPTAKAVNEALRSLVAARRTSRVIRRTQSTRRRTSLPGKGSAPRQRKR